MSEWSRNSGISRDATWTHPVRHGGSIVRIRLHGLVSAPFFADLVHPGRVLLFPAPGSRFPSLRIFESGRVRFLLPAPGLRGCGSGARYGLQPSALVRLGRRRVLLFPRGFLDAFRARLPRRTLRHHPTKRCPPAFSREERRAVAPRTPAEPCSRDATGDVHGCRTVRSIH